MARKDKKNRVLQKGESQRKDGTYMYRYTNPSGDRKYVYASTLSELRDKKKNIQRDLNDGIFCDKAKTTLNQLFYKYISLKNIANSTKNNYIMLWDLRVKDSFLANMKLENIKKSDVKYFYKSLVEDGLKYSTIKTFDCMIRPCFQMAVDDDIIRKNPSIGCAKEFKMRDEKKRISLTKEQQDEFLNYIKNHNVYSIYYPMFLFMLETALRCGEVIGLTWNDIDFKNKTVTINHQLIYKKYNGKYCFYASSPKTSAGCRVIPLTNAGLEILKQQRKQQFALNRRTDITIDGYSDFVFSTKHKRPMMPSAVNNILLNIINSYNSKKDDSKKDLPHISAHVLRHTGCTRMAEAGIDPKVLQYLMGHSEISVTMNIYNHISHDRTRAEIEKFELNRVI